MKKQMKIATCLACGKHGEVNFEHIPPQSCGNKQTRYHKGLLKDFLVSELNKNVNKKILQGGVGEYAFCPDCNNKFGIWYVKEYANWHKETQKFFKLITKGLAMPFEIFPLRIIKQIICMFIAINKNNELFEIYKGELAEFVLDKEKNDLDVKYRIWAYYNYGGNPRFSPLFGLGNVEKIDTVNGI